ncbi:unnamed protein product [Heligmosomoides polygyrus]|uniref:Uncharacterized protein n=1 Tax=Heligmosomoides polygyrus TaxID=6339 RepID=A0A3P8CS92_HELPZ|nr:unnamed protein product [Heligmosomoides polygyrus]
MAEKPFPARFGLRSQRSSPYLKPAKPASLAWPARPAYGAGEAGDGRWLRKHPQLEIYLQEQYLALLAQLSPSGCGDFGGMTGSISSLLTIDSLLTGDGTSVATGTPDVRRRNQTAEFGRYATSIRNSGGKPGSRGSLMMNPTVSWSSSGDRILQKTLLNAIGNLTRRNLYILVEKGHTKIFRGDKNIEFIPITFPSTHQMKISFKKLLRVMRPSVAFVDSSSTTFYRSLDESDWLQLVCLQSIP